MVSLTLMLSIMGLPLSAANAGPEIVSGPVALTDARSIANHNNSSIAAGPLPPSGHYSVAPSPTISSQTLYDVIFTPAFGDDPIVATPLPLGNAQTNSIFPFGIAASPSDIVSVGASETGTNGPDHAFSYSLVANTTTDLGALGGPDAVSFAYGISNDASTIVGASFVSTNLAGPIHAFRIGSDGTMVDLGSLTGASGNSTAFAANGDGSVVVGQTNVPGGNQHAFLWTLTPGSDTGTMTDLGGSGSFATAVNFDGSVTVGANTVNIVNGNVHTSALHAALWNGTNGPVDLGVLPGDVASIATGVSADGTVVVGISDPVGLSGQAGASGYGYNFSTSHAFVWTQATGMQNLTTALSQAGVLASGSSLVAALGIAPNGQIIVGAGVLPTTPFDSTTAYQARYCNGNCPNDSTPIVAAVLPASRSIGVGGTATAFATIINPLGTALNHCLVAPVTALPASFAYQTTDPTTNALTGTANTPVTIPAGGSQSFVFALTANAAFPPTQVKLGFECTYTDAAAIEVGLNTLLLSASATLVPDVVALGATTSNDGILHIPNGSAAFAVATVNLGAGSTITATANTGAASLPLTLTLCQTNPPTGQCLAPPAASVTTAIAAMRRRPLRSSAPPRVPSRSTRRAAASLSSSPTRAASSAALPASPSKRNKTQDVTKEAASPRTPAYSGSLTTHDIGGDLAGCGKTR
jgi:probable HAF family extracellular repeat protein